MTRRRENNPRKLPSGRWQVRTRVGGRNRYRSFDTKTEATRYLDLTRAEIARGTHVDPQRERTRFRAVADEWLRGAQHRPATQQLYRSHLDKHILPAFGDRAVGSIRRVDVQEWVGELELAPTTVATVFRVLAGVLSHAVEERMIVASPARKIALPEAAGESQLVVPITSAQVHELAAAMPPRYRALVLFAASTGLRQGECLGLLTSRVDLAARTVRVDQQMVTPSAGEPYLGPPKTKASHRVVPIGEWTVGLLEQHLAEFPPVDGRVWSDSRGWPVRRQRIAEAFSAAVESCGLVDVTFHDLRHHYASLLIAAGTSVKTVQVLLGHSSAVETLNTYAHLWPGSDDQTRATIDAAFRSQP